MYKVGDEVLVKGSIAEIENDEYDACPVAVGFDKGRSEWFGEEELIPVGKTYEQGLADAWELAKKIENRLGSTILEPIFGSSSISVILDNFTAEEALAKIEAYERKQEIKVGDEVKTILGKTNGIVTRVYSECCYVVWADGVCGEYQKSHLEKTGKHIDIESLLKQIGE